MISVFTGSSCLQAEEDFDMPRLITVVGTGEVKVVPDEVNLTVGVQTKDLSLQVAKKNNDDIVRKIFEVVKRHKIENKNVQTSRINIYPEYQRRNRELDEQFMGYRIDNTVSIKLTEIDKFEDLLSDLVQSKVNRVQGISFNSSELLKHKAEARLKAVREAKEKAKALAKELGQDIGKPFSISEENITPRPYMMKSMAFDGGGARGESGGTFAPGEIKITANVTVSFELK